MNETGRFQNPNVAKSILGKTRLIKIQTRYERLPKSIVE